MDHELPPLEVVAALQGGAFTVAQARERGLSAADIAAAERTQRWYRVARGIYVERAVWETMDARARHLCSVHGRLLTLQPGWVAGRRSAVLAHGLPLLGKPPDVPQLVRQPPRTTDRSSSRHERLSTVPADETTVVDGLAVSSLARTVADIGREESFRSAVVVADAALRRGLDPEVLEGVARRCRSWPGGV